MPINLDSRRPTTAKLLIQQERNNYAGTGDPIEFTVPYLSSVVSDCLELILNDFNYLENQNSDTAKACLKLAALTRYLEEQGRRWEEKGGFHGE